MKVIYSQGSRRSSGVRSFGLFVIIFNFSEFRMDVSLHFILVFTFELSFIGTNLICVILSILLRHVTTKLPIISTSASKRPESIVFAYGLNISSVLWIALVALEFLWNWNVLDQRDGKNRQTRLYWRFCRNTVAVVLEFLPFTLCQVQRGF
jgi:hypothetical protein